MSGTWYTNKVTFVIGLAAATISTLAVILAFSLPSWIYTYGQDSRYGINYAGLWTFCLDNFFDHRYRYNDGKPMYGCHWIYSDYLEDIRWRVLNPEWYIAVQIMATTNLVMSLIGLIGLYVHCGVSNNICPLIAGAIAMFLSTLLGFGEVFLYAFRYDDPEYYRVPNMQSKSLGAGWGFAVIGALFAMFAHIMLVISCLSIRKQRRIMKESMKDLYRQQTEQEFDQGRGRYDY